MNQRQGRDTPDSDLGSPEPGGFAAWMLVAMVCVVQFVDVLGTTIVIVALPTIQADLRLSDGNRDLVAGIYALLFGAFLILSGELSDLFGARKLFVAGLVVFGVASLAGGLAPSAMILIAARAGQGLGAALAVPSAMAMVTSAFPAGALRNRVLGIWTATGAGGGAAGFAIGGVITDGPGWRWIFLLNVPIILLALVLVPRLAPRDRIRLTMRSLNVASSILLTAGLLALILGLSNLEGASATSIMVAGPMGAGLGMLAAFVLLEKSTGRPLVPNHLLHLRSLMVSSFVGFGLTFVTSAIVLLTVYLQLIAGVGPAEAGIRLAPFSLAVIAGSFLGTPLTTRLGTGKTMSIGVGALVVSRLMFLVGIEYEDLAWISAGLTLSGIGLGAASVSSTALGLEETTDEDKGVSSGLLNSAARLGTAIGIAMLGVIASLRTDAIDSGPNPSHHALAEGFRLAFILATLFAAAMLPVIRQASVHRLAPSNRPQR